MDILTAVIQVLKDHERPSHYKQIAKEINDRKLVKNAGQTVETLVNAKVGVDIKNYERDGVPPRFQKLPNGYIALTESAYDEMEEDDLDYNRVEDFDDEEYDENDDKYSGEEYDEEDDSYDEDIDGKEIEKPLRHHHTEKLTEDYEDRKLTQRDVLAQVDEYKKGVSYEFVRHLNHVDFASFERMLTSLIRSFYVRRSTIVNRRKDGGMDYAINLGFFRNNLNLLVAVRRWGPRRPVSKEDILETFERMDSHGFNGCVFVTTGDFEADVYDYVEEFKDFPFFVVNGEKLAWLMLERGIGVRTSKINLYQFHAKKPGYQHNSRDNYRGGKNTHYKKHYNNDNRQNKYNDAEENHEPPAYVTEDDE